MFDAENVQYTMCTSDEYDGYALPCGYYLGDQPISECPNYELYNCEECIASADTTWCSVSTGVFGDQVMCLPNENDGYREPCGSYIDDTPVSTCDVCLDNN